MERIWGMTTLIPMLWGCEFLGAKRRRNQSAMHRTPVVAREKFQTNPRPIYVVNAVYSFSILFPYNVDHTTHHASLLGLSSRLQARLHLLRAAGRCA